MPTLRVLLSLGFLLSLLVLPLGCGKNIFSSLNASDPAEEASKALEQNKPQKAVNLLLSALGSGYRNLYYQLEEKIAQGESEEIRASLEELVDDLLSTGKLNNAPALISILASAQAKLYGIDPFDLAFALASDSAASDSSQEEQEGGQAGEESEQNEITALFPVLPEATTTHLHGLTAARLILDSMGSENFTQADYFKKALFLTANAALTLKLLDSDADGSISPQEAISLSSNNASLLLDLLLDATEAVLNTSEAETDSNAAKSAETIATIRETILSSEGSDDAEKLKNYLGAQNTP